MKVIIATVDSTEPTIMLKNTEPGACIRFAHDSFEDSIKCDLFWMRVDAPELKERVRLINIVNGKQLERDGDHRVIVHYCTLSILN